MNLKVTKEKIRGAIEIRPGNSWRHLERDFSFMFTNNSKRSLWLALKKGTANGKANKKT
jgi:hypothetical protein